MTVNQYSGDVDLLIIDKSYKLRYDWTAIAELKSQLGPEFDTAIAQASVGFDMEVIATALDIGLRRHHEDELTVKDIVAVSPPVIPVTTAINQALTIAFHGTLEVPEFRDANPPLLTRIRTLIAAWSAKRRKPSTNTV